MFSLVAAFANSVLTAQSRSLLGLYVVVAPMSFSS